MSRPMSHVSAMSLWCVCVCFYLCACVCVCLVGALVTLPSNKQRGARLASQSRDTTYQSLIVKPNYLNMVSKSVDPIVLIAFS